LQKLGCGSVGEHLPHVIEALDSIPAPIIMMRMIITTRTTKIINNNNANSRNIPTKVFFKKHIQYAKR
jgi:hypothetical protein